MRKAFLNTFLFGFVTGVAIQLLSFLILLYVNKSVVGYTERSSFDFLEYLMNYDTGREVIIPKLLSLAAIADLLLFFIFIWTEKLLSARGAIGAAFLMGIVIVLLKFVL